MSPKTGRPTTNPRPNKISVRINDKTLNKIDHICKEENVSRSDVIEKAVEALPVSDK